jgi:hypothetical protein
MEEYPQLPKTNGNRNLLNGDGQSDSSMDEYSHTFVGVYVDEKSLQPSRAVTVTGWSTAYYIVNEK